MSNFDRNTLTGSQDIGIQGINTWQTFGEVLGHFDIQGVWKINTLTGRVTYDPSSVTPSDEDCDDILYHNVRNWSQGGQQTYEKTVHILAYKPGFPTFDSPQTLARMTLIRTISKDLEDLGDGKGGDIAFVDSLLSILSVS